MAEAQEDTRTAADVFREASPSGGVAFPRDEDTQARALANATASATPEAPAQEISPLKVPYQNGGPILTNPTTPVGRSMGTPIREDTPAAPGVLAAGSMASDQNPEQRRRIVARQLFPNLPQLEAESRVFPGVNGRLAVVGDDGKASYIDPPPYSPDINQPKSLIPTHPVARIAGMSGPGLPAGGAIIGGSIAAPTSLVAGPLAAGAGAAIGDAARQSFAQQLDPGIPAPPDKPQAGPRAVNYNWKQTAHEGLGAALGQLLGAGVVRGFRPNPMGASDYDLRMLRDPVIQQRIADRYARADAQGVPLTPGQASGLPSLLGMEDAYTSGSAGPAGADIAKRFYERQQPKVIAAFDDTAGRVSPQADKTDAALQFQQGATDAERIVRQQTNAQAKPYYDAARAGGSQTSPDLDILANVPAVKTALEAAGKEYENRFRLPPPTTPNFDMWNLAKIKLDEAHSAAKLAGQNSTADSIDALRTDLRTHLDAVYPTYEMARDTAAPGLREAARLGDITGVGKADLGTERVRAIVSPLFESNNPRAIGAARESFIKAGKEAEWNAGTRAYMQDLFDKTVQSQEGFNPGMLRRQLWSDPNKQASMRAAMDPQTFQGFENFMGTLEDVARARGANSATAGRLASAADLKERARDTPGSKLIGALKFLSLEAAPRAADNIQNWMASRNVNRMGEYLFSENGQEYLRQMGRLPPGARSIAATARFLGQQGGVKTAPVAPPPSPSGQELSIPRMAEGLLGLR